MSERDEELDIPTPLGPLRSKNYRAMDLIAMAVVVALVVSPFIAFDYHRAEIEKRDDAWSKVLQSREDQYYKQLAEVLRATREITIVTRYQTCVMALPEKQRWNELQKGGR